MPTVAAFGNFDLDGGRSWAIRTGLAERGFDVELCRTERPGLMAKYRDLRRQWKSRAQRADVLYVPFLGHYLLPLAWWIGKREKIPVVFDAFLSLYDTDVSDRARYPRWHPMAWLLWCADWICCRLCDVVLLDTPEHADYFVRTFGAKREKILALPIGCRTDLFRPMQTAQEQSQTLRVEFHGTFIPLQGIDVILQAAHLLQNAHEDVSFELIGKGQTYDAMHALAAHLSLTNVSFAGSVPMAELPSRIAAADVCLGIFAATPKADRVIPNKAYEVLACGKPLLIAATLAARRVFTQSENVLLCKPGDAPALADALLQLKRDPALRRKIAAKGRELCLERFTPYAIVEPLSEWLRGRLHG